MINLVVSSPLFQARFKRCLPAGQSIVSLLEAVDAGPEHFDYLEVRLAGEVVPREMWAHVKPKANVLVQVSILPSGGDNGTLRVGALLLAVFANFGVVSKLVGGVPGFLVGLGLTAAAWWAINTFIAPPTKDTPRDYAISGFRNDARPYGLVPRVYGRMRVFPPFAAEPYHEVVGNDLYIRALFLLGQKPLRVDTSNLKIGDTPLAGMQGVTFQIIDGWEDRQDAAIEIYTNDIHEQTIEQELKWAPEWYRESQNHVPVSGRTVRAGGTILQRITLNPYVLTAITQVDTQEIGVVFTFPDGLGIKSSSGDDLTSGNNVTLGIRYRPVGATGETSWKEVVPVWSQAFLNDELHPILNSDWFAWLTDLNEELDNVNTALTGIVGVDRIVDHLLFQYLKQRMDSAYSMVTQAQSWDDLTTEQQNTLLDSKDRLTQLYAQLETATQTTQEIEQSVSGFNDQLSGLLTILEGVDTLVAIRQYIRRGQGPDIDTLTNSPLINELIRWYLTRQGLEHLFGEPPTGTFDLYNPDMVKGVIRRSVTWPVPPGQYEVQIRRVSKPHYATDAENPDDPQYDDRYLEKVMLSEVRSVATSQAISDRIKDRYALAAVRIKSTSQLTGNLDTFNCIAEAPLPWYKDGDGWQPAALVDDDGKTVSRCPAWIVADMLRGTGNKLPIDDSKIDSARLLEWADYCHANQFYYSTAIDKVSTLQQALESVCRVGKASPAVRDGKYSVVYDHEQTTPVDILSPRTTADFSFTKTMSRRPHALRMTFINPDKGWINDEWLVYDDGFGNSTRAEQHTGRFTPAGNRIIFSFELLTMEKLVDLDDGHEISSSEYFIGSQTGPYGDPVSYLQRTDGQDWPAGLYRYRAYVALVPKEATRLENVSMDGLVDSPDKTSIYHTGQVYALGRYLLKVMVHRPEVFQLTLDFAHLRFERGDRVDVQHDLTLWGIGSGRLAAAPTRDGDDNVTAVKLDERVIMDAGGSYQIRFRSSTGVLYVADLVTVEGENEIVTLAAPLDAPELAWGDLAIWGVRQRVTTDCIVKSIEPQQDLQAKVTLLQHSPMVHDAAEELIPDFDSNITLPPDPSLTRPPAPEVTDVKTDERVIVRMSDGSLQSRARIAYRLPTGSSAAEQDAARKVTSLETEYQLLYLPPVDGANPLTVQYSPGDRASWIKAPMVARDAGEIYIDQVQDGLYYEFRVRAVTAAGIPSEWTHASAQIVGKTSPPPDVLQVRLEGMLLRWDYTPPIDFAGFQVRHIAGAGGSWESAAPSHAGLLSESSFDISGFNGGYLVFFIKGIDTSGNESRHAARVAVVKSPGQDNDHVLIRTSHKPTWPGTKTNFSINGANNLAAIAGNKVGFYVEAGFPFYRNSNDPFYGTDYPWSYYYIEHECDNSQLPYSLRIEASATGEHWRIEYKELTVALWPQPQDMGQPLWPARVQHELWPAMDWKPMQGKKEAKLDTTYAFRLVSLPGNVQTIVTQFDLIQDVPLVSEHVEDFDVASTGTVRLPIKKAYRAIVNVGLTLQQDAVTYPDAQSVELLDKDVAGPQVAVYDGSHARAGGLIDADVKGY